MGEIVTIGLDLAKNVFQVHAVDSSGAAVLKKAIRRAQVLAFFRNLPNCLRHRPSLGPRADRLGARSAPDAAAICESLCEAEQERRCGC
jgi:transposase